jgi:hypothetical protein
MSRAVQYIRPRCPRCKRNFRGAQDQRLRQLGYELQEIAREQTRVRLRCRWCGYDWWSHNRVALGAVSGSVTR